MAAPPFGCTCVSAVCWCLVHSHQNTTDTDTFAVPSAVNSCSFTGFSWNSVTGAPGRGYRVHHRRDTSNAKKKVKFSTFSQRFFLSDWFISGMLMHFQVLIFLVDLCSIGNLMLLRLRPRFLQFRLACVGLPSPDHYCANEINVASMSWIFQLCGDTRLILSTDVKVWSIFLFSLTAKLGSSRLTLVPFAVYFLDCLDVMMLKHDTYWPTNIKISGVRRSSASAQFLCCVRARFSPAFGSGWLMSHNFAASIPALIHSSGELLRGLPVAQPAEWNTSNSSETMRREAENGPTCWSSEQQL